MTTRSSASCATSYSYKALCETTGRTALLKRNRKDLLEEGEAELYLLNSFASSRQGMISGIAILRMSQHFFQDLQMALTMRSRFRYKLTARLTLRRLASFFGRFELCQHGNESTMKQQSRGNDADYRVIRIARMTNHLPLHLNHGKRVPNMAYFGPCDNKARNRSKQH